ncbi:hypothetical protein ACH5RR_013480 [Cinchona calisaya]|uniref:Uncharacterized protein n=1 Tax=Cinchona calisaya TaxID=153742 RepID=A0ABD3A5W9_9GENT
MGSANNGGLLNGGIFVAAPVRTSSCTKEEVDAILIQCGRLSRSSSTGKAANLSGSCGSGGESNSGINPHSSHSGRNYSGSKRSYDFDNENGSDGRDGDKIHDDNVVVGGGDDGNEIVGEQSHRHRQRHRQSRTVGSPSKGRRRTLSREREQQEQGQGQQPRSGSSRERGNNSGNGSGRRVSRSPGRRSESPISTTTSNGVVNSSLSGNGNRPRKMVSVPATVSSLVTDESNNAGGGGNETISASAVKRIQVKRNVTGGADAAVCVRTAASPRARSPARGNVKVLNENQNHHQQTVSLSRSNSRKAEHSPFRRNPLSEIDTNVIIEQVALPGIKAANNILPQALNQKPNSDYSKFVVQGTDYKMSDSKQSAHQAVTSNAALNMDDSGPECLKPLAITRSRSSRLSRDLDINPEMLSNTSPSYTALLLEDIQNFHQKTNTPAITLPPCLSKACTILEAVANLNSTSSDKRRIPTVEQFNKLYDNASFGVHPDGCKGLQTKDLFVQSQVVGSDNIMEPSFHKYVTVGRGGEDMEEQESSGSNSFVGGQHYWNSPSSWEPKSADSTNDCWTSSRSNNIRDAEEVARRRLSEKKRDSDQQQNNGIGRGRIASRGIHSVPTVTAAST